MRYQLVEGESYRILSDKTTLSTATMKASRGEILDRYGRNIATSRVGHSVVLNYVFLPSISKQSDKLNKIILQITSILKEDSEQWVDNLPISTTTPINYISENASGIKSLQTLLKISSNVTASDALKLLCDKYNIDSTLSITDKRIIAGARYEMEIREFSSSNNTLVFATDVGMTTVTKVSEFSLDLPGVEITQDPIRIYTDGTIAAQTIGNVSPIFANEYTTLKKNGYGMDDTIGRGGIEQAMEQYLRGTDGSKRIEVSKSGTVTKEIITTAPKPGDTVVTTIDSRLQLVLQNSLELNIKKIAADAKGDVVKGANANAGAAVVIDIKTGEVLAMASYPTYDLNTYKANYAALIKQAGNPFNNRCVQGTYRPGSTFKPVTATGALMNNAITRQTTFTCVGKLTRYGHTFNCDTVHGVGNVIRAISVSCNFFFYNAGDLLGIDKLDQTAKGLGLGEPTGIELPEKTGVLAGREERTTNNGIWYPGDTLQASIGQSDNMFTPIQLANYVATLMNSGTRYQVHLVKQVNSYDNQSVVLQNNPKIMSKMNIPADVLSAVKTGMGSVTENGTASNVFGTNYPIRVGGKTGTAEVPGGYNGVFISFAPYDNPQIAVACVIEHGYHGGQIAFVAKDVYDAYFMYNNNVQAPVMDNTLLQ